MSEKPDESSIHGHHERPVNPRRHSSLQRISQNPLLSSRFSLAAGNATGGEKSRAGDSASVPDDCLPPPAVAFIPPDPSSKLRVQWAKLKRRIGNGSAPSESLGDPTTTTESDAGSLRRRNGLGVQNQKEDDEEEVDEIVVDQSDEYAEWKKTTLPSHSASGRGAGTGTTPGTAPVGTMQSDASSLRQTAYEANGVIEVVTGFVRYRAWPIISRFFSPAYHDDAVEESFQKEQWYNGKSLAIFGSFYLIMNWVLTVSLLPRPWSTWNEVQLYGLGPVLSVPLIVLAALDWPRKHVWQWQSLVFASIWITAAANPIDMYKCGFYTATPHCGNKDYMATFYYAMSGPVIGIFALGMKRILLVIYALSWILLVAITILPRRVAFVRNVVNLILFQGFICFIHYMREMADRRMYTMRAELKISFRAKQRAQINERKMMDAKRRFSSYIFHEVRVPLNTALLAVQNLSGLNLFDKHGEHAIEYQALEGSLQMMSQVLNDVLDFSRMERGGFSTVSNPFSPHRTMRSIFVPLRLDAAARGLTLETYLDPRIDKLALQATYPDCEIGDVEPGEGRVMGDEMRLRQVIGNLVSNACKFTKAGGKITVTTTLIYPDQDDNSQQSSTPPELAGHEIHGLVEPVDTAYSPRLSAGRLKSHEEKTSPKQNEMLVIRFEVSDTGVGIKKSDMAENRLFSPYVQTAAGREQGGKGTGLGLSLVRQIVMLSGGRLGVRSKFGHGTTIYADYPFVLGPQTREGSGDEAPRHFRKNTMGGDTLVDEKGKIDPATPYSDGSATSDYRFVASLRKKSSDPTLDSIDESGQPIGRPRDSSVSTQLSVPAAYRFSSPPTSPGIGSEPPSPSVFVQAPSPPQLHITTEPQSRTIGENSPVSPMVFSHPFLRPENRSHVSSASAPAQVTLPSASPSSASSPVVTPSLAGRPPASTGSKILDFPDGPLRVLVVDDDALTRKLMSRMMERLGCLVTTAENGKLALDKLIAPAPSATSSGDGKETTIEGTSTDDVDVAERGMAGGVMKQPKRVKMEGIDPASGVDAHKHFDITFLDNQMPVMSGVQVVAKLRSLGRDDFVVGVTANALLSDQEQYLESGASFILTKPVKEADLRKYLNVANTRRTESKDPALRRQAIAMKILSGPTFPVPPSILSHDED